MKKVSPDLIPFYIYATTYGPLYYPVNYSCALECGYVKTVMS